MTVARRLRYTCVDTAPPILPVAATVRLRDRGYRGPEGTGTGIRRAVGSIFDARVVGPRSQGLGPRLQ